MPKRFNIDIIFVLLIMLSIGLRLYFSRIPNLYIDESLWWKLSKHLSLNNYIHAPLPIWLVSLTTSLGGDTEFFVRLGWIIAFIFSTIFIYFLGKDISNSRRVGLYSAVLLNSIPLFSLEAMIAVPESLEVFFYLAILYYFLKAVNNQSMIWWIVTGVFLGLGLLTRYSIGFIIPVLFIFLSTSHKQKIWLHKKRFYLTLGIAFLLFSYNLIWNILHDGGAFKEAFSKFRDCNFDTLSIRGLISFISQQAILVSPLFYIFFLMVIPLCGFTARKEQDDSLWLLFLSSSTMISFLFLLCLFKKYPPDPDWLSMGFIPLIIFTAIAFNKLYYNLKKKHIAALILLGLCVFNLLYTGSLGRNMISPTPPFYKLFKGTFDGFYGWPELAARINNTMKDEPSDEETILLSPDRYIISELSFYLRNKSIYYMNSESKIVGRDFESWGDVPPGRDALYITSTPIKEKMPLHLKNFFGDIQEMEPIEIFKENKPIKIFYLYKLLS